MLMQEHSNTASLSKEEILRYSRHLILPEVGMTGQIKLKQAKVLLIGMGGLGSPIALYLTAAGIGTLGIVDFDVVDMTNLQRQVIHSNNTVGLSKIQSATERLKALNPELNIIPFEHPLTSDNALQIINDFDIIVDGTDNFPTRYLINDACVFLEKPLVYGSIFRFEGQATVFDSTKGPCYRCLYSEPPPPDLVPSCADGGVIGILPGIIGSIQANEVIKLVLGIGKPLIGRLMLFDALEMEWREFSLKKNPDCVVCSEHPSVTSLIDYEEFCGVGTNKPPQLETTITVSQLKDSIDSEKNIAILDVREPHELLINKIAGSISIPWEEIESETADLSKIPKNKKVIVYCRTGSRSARAIGVLQDKGFTNLYNLIGGITAWAKIIDNNMPIY